MLEAYFLMIKYADDSQLNIAQDKEFRKIR